MRQVRLLIILMMSLFASLVEADYCLDVFPDSVTSNSSATLNVPTWSSNDHLQATSGTDSFDPGDTFKASGQISGDYSIVSTGTSVRLYFTSLTISGNVELNAGGNPKDLIIVVDGSIQINGNPTINAILYATGSISYNGNGDNTASITGAVTSENTVSIDNVNQVSYDSSYILDADFGSLCSPFPQPTAYWSFNSITGLNVSDDSGNGHDGILGANSTGDGDEPVGQCGVYLEYDGADDFVNVADDAALDIEDELTVAVWIRPDRYPSSGLMTILSKDENYEFHLNPDGTINWWWNNSSGFTREFDSNTSVPLNQWTHVAIVYSRSQGTQTIYINGVADASRSYTNQSLRTNNDPLQIGNDQYFSGRYFSGDIDEVYVFEAALSQTLVQNLMETEPEFCGDDDALAFYIFDQETWNGTAGEVSDGSGNGADGRAVNGAQNRESDPARTGSPGTCQYGDFDGQDDYLTTDDSTTLLQISNDYSTAVWVKGAVVSDQNQWAGIYTKSNPSGGTNHWNLQRENFNDALVVFHGSNSWDTGISLTQVSESWHHVGLVYSGTTMTSYLDGVQVSSSTFSSSPGNGDGHLNIGADRTQSGDFVWNGSIDELYIFNEAISSDDMAQLYNQTRPCESTPSCRIDYVDQFSSTSYSNSDGSSDWTTNNWVEENDDGSPTGDQVQIVSGELRISGGGISQRRIYRAVNLGNAISAELSFDIRESGAEPTDSISVEVYDGSSWTTLETFNGSLGSGGSRNYDLSSYLSSDFRVRFVENASWYNDYFYIDNLVISGVCQNLDHLEISVSENASTCSPVAVTIKACEDSAVPCVTPVSDYAEEINLTVSSNRGDWSTNSAQGSIDNGTADDGAATYQFVASDGGSAVLNLTYIYADKVTITASDLVNNLSVTSGVVTFSDNAFLVKWDDSIHSGSETDPTVAVAGRDHSATITYIAKDSVTNECQVVGSYTGADKPVFVWMTPATGVFTGAQTQPSLKDMADSDDVVLPFDQPAVSNLNLDFTNGVANVDLVTSDVGQFSFSILDDSGFVQDEQGNAIDVLGTSSQVTVRPFGFALDIGGTCTIPSGDRGSNSNATLATDHTKTPGFKAAGENFDLSVKGVLWASEDDGDSDGIPDDFSNLYNNACVPSLGNESSAVSLGLQVSGFIPSGGTQGDLSVNAVSGFSNGLASQTLSYDEVGSVDITATLDDYLGASGADASGQILNLGRFYPHHFSVTSNTPVLNDATGWGCDFTYQSQLFNFETDIKLTVTAKELGGETTNNYGNDYYKLGTPSAIASFTNGASSAASLKDYTVAASAAVSGLNDYDGEVEILFSGYQLAYDKAGKPVAEDKPFEAIINWILPKEALTDSDGACVDDPANCASVTVADIQGTEIRYGRAVVGNNNGSELMPLELPLRVELWMDVSASGAASQYSFVTNTNDTCSGDTWTDSNITLSEYKGKIVSGDTTGSFNGFANGVGVLELSAPGVNNQGSVNVTFDVDEWLHFDFYNRGDEDPTGTGTFGVYSGRPPIFYMRESYR
ncbi:LamG domain-containing protein [Litoribrevibacter albus]|uniref:LamG-like jellyroll fold domain-containing protein n=1 Tax=Litoribrevibacter albus TaxID=1473156 RepID=A0AA37SEB7_9GAMM|nr:LamG domain-containing protein [Litoribrevibacter albus]GLQ33503.1 hypothetical protein GCM10007876_39830 [Litoribrevibacter albus]